MSHSLVICGLAYSKVNQRSAGYPGAIQTVVGMQ